MKRIPEFAIPNSALLYILMQRTHYLRLQKTFFLRLVSHLVGQRHRRIIGLQVEGLLRRKRIKRDYFSEISSEYEELRSFLPEAVASVMDIGCGIGGIDALLNVHYGPKKPHFFMVDRSLLEADIHYLFAPQASFYNSLDLTKAFLLRNGMEAPQLTMVDVAANPSIRVDAQLDLVISLISWGFHYPVHTYLDEVISQLGEGGTLILDVRKNTDGEAMIRGSFEETRIVRDHTKRVRLAATRPIKSNSSALKANMRNKQVSF